MKYNITFNMYIILIIVWTSWKYLLWEACPQYLMELDKLLAKIFNYSLLDVMEIPIVGDVSLV